MLVDIIASGDRIVIRELIGRGTRTISLHDNGDVVIKEKRVGKLGGESVFDSYRSMESSRKELREDH